MPEVNFAVTYWHIESEADMAPVVKELLGHGYTGTITGLMQPPLSGGTPVETWLMSLVKTDGTVSPVAVGDVVVWNGFAAQVMSHIEFANMVNLGS